MHIVFASRPGGVLRFGVRRVHVDHGVLVLRFLIKFLIQKLLLARDGLGVDSDLDGRTSDGWESHQGLVPTQHLQLEHFWQHILINYILMDIV